MFTPPSVKSTEPGGKKGTIANPGWWGAGNWNTGAFDPETGVYYAVSHTWPAVYHLSQPTEPEATLDYAVTGDEDEDDDYPLIDGIPIVKPPYGRITAIDMNKGEHLWMSANGDGPRHHPLLKDLNLPPLGIPGRGAPLLTKTLLFVGEGGDAIPGIREGMWGTKFRAFDKAKGERALGDGFSRGHHRSSHDVHVRRQAVHRRRHRRQGGSRGVGRARASVRRGPGSIYRSLKSIELLATPGSERGPGASPSHAIFPGSRWARGSGSSAVSCARRTPSAATTRSPKCSRCRGPSSLARGGARWCSKRDADSARARRSSASRRASREAHSSPAIPSREFRRTTSGTCISTAGRSSFAPAPSADGWSRSEKRRGVRRDRSLPVREGLVLGRPPPDRRPSRRRQSSTWTSRSRRAPASRSSGRGSGRMESSFLSTASCARHTTFSATRSSGAEKWDRSRPASRVWETSKLLTLSKS